jgi:hypothetical protein
MIGATLLFGTDQVPRTHNLHNLHVQIISYDGDDRSEVTTPPRNDPWGCYVETSKYGGIPIVT